jgi:hypothetical protein
MLKKSSSGVLRSSEKGEVRSEKSRGSYLRSWPLFPLLFTFSFSLLPFIAVALPRERRVSRRVGGLTTAAFLSILHG